MRRSNRQVAFWLAGVVALAACGGDGGGGSGTTAPQTGSASGTVVNEGNNNAGVSGVTLSMQQGTTTRTATTSSDGAFTFSNLNTGAWTLQLALPSGFELGTNQQASQNVNVTAGQTTAIGNLRIRPLVTNPTTGTISGTVTSGGNAVSNVTIALTGGGSVTTNASGAYTFANLTPGAYTVTLTVPQGFTLAAGQTAAKSANVVAGATSTVDWELQAQSGGNLVQIDMINISFNPSSVNVPLGATVRWTNRDGVAHTSTANNGEFASGNVNSGGTFEYVANTAGTINYRCTIHEGMNGTLVVQ